MAELITAYPEIAALIVLVVGVLAASLLKQAARRALTTLDENLSRRSTTQNAILTPTLLNFSISLVFWLTVAVAGATALAILNVEQLSKAIDGVMGFIGNAVVGVAIVGAGHFVGLLARGMSQRVEILSGSSNLVGRSVYGGILLVAVVMGLEQLEINTDFVTNLLLAVLTISTGAIALAFALGARQHVANLLAQHELAKFNVGERILIGSTEGTVINIGSTGMELGTSDGIVSIPGSHFARLSVRRIVEGEDE